MGGTISKQIPDPPRRKARQRGAAAPKGRVNQYRKDRPEDPVLECEDAPEPECKKMRVQSALELAEEMAQRWQHKVRLEDVARSVEDERRALYQTIRARTFPLDGGRGVCQFDVTAAGEFVLRIAVGPGAVTLGRQEAREFLRWLGEELVSGDDATL